MPEAFSVDPNVVYLLLLIGLWSGVTAAYVPGTGIVEIISAAVSVAALLLLTSLPTNWGAVLMVIVGAAGFLIMPLLHQRLALFAVIGLVLQAVGSLFLFNEDSVSVPLIAVTIALSLLYHHFVLLPALRSQHRARELESDRLLGARGRVVQPVKPVGTVQAGGELWSARSDRPLESGDEVVVVDRDGLVLIVEAVKQKREDLNGRDLDNGGPL